MWRKAERSRKGTRVGWEKPRLLDAEWPRSTEVPASRHRVIDRPPFPYRPSRESFSHFWPHLRLCCCPAGAGPSPRASLPGGRADVPRAPFSSVPGYLYPMQGQMKTSALQVTSFPCSSQGKQTFWGVVYPLGLSVTSRLRRKHIRVLKTEANEKHPSLPVVFMYVDADVGPGAA